MILVLPMLFFLLLLLSCCQICFLIVLASYPVSVHRSDAPPTQHIRACGTMLTGRTTGSHHPRYARHDFETRYVSFKTRYVFPLRVAFLFFTRYVFFHEGRHFRVLEFGCIFGPENGPKHASDQRGAVKRLLKEMASSRVWEQSE